jgi:SOS response regulatory protein OraA/RecX
VTSIIEIQETYIARVMAAFAKVTPRTKGNRFGRAKRAARKQAVTRLIKRGYSAKDATQIINDAHDVFLLEVSAMGGES